MSNPRRQLIETWFNRVWTQQDIQAIYEMFPAGTAEGLGAQTITTPDQLVQFQQKMTQLLEDISVEVDKFVEMGDWIGALCTLKAQAIKTKTSVVITGSVFVRVDEKTILEAYNHWDFPALWEQLGLLPEGSFFGFLEGRPAAFVN